MVDFDFSVGEDIEMEFTTPPEIEFGMDVPGKTGKSAYDIWLEQGNVGTEEDFIESLKGEPGYTPQKGVDYFDGEDGYTPQKGVDYFDGKDGYTPQKGIDYFDGKDGEDYILTEPDKEEIAEKVAEKVEIPDEYVTETELEAKGYQTKTEADNTYQPKGSYATEEQLAETEAKIPTVPSWAQQASKPTYTKKEVGLGNVDDVKQYSASNPPPYPVTSVNGQTGAVTVDVPTALSQLSGDSTHRTVTDAEKTAWNNKSNFSGSYNDLTNKPTIPTVPTKVSAFTNDSGYQTEAQVQALINDALWVIETSTSYVKKEALTVANNIDTSAGTFKMIFVTDLHNMDDVPRLEHANQAIQTLCRVTDIDCVVFGGDYIRNWVGITKEEAIEDIEKCRKKFANQIVPTFWLRGNHDTNGYVGERISKEEAYNLIANKNVDNGVVINSADPYGNYGYVDFSDKKVRLVLVNTSDNDLMVEKPVSDPANTADHINCHNVSATQLQWLADNALSFTESGWKVIFVSHLPLYWSTGSSPAWYNQHTYTDGNGKVWTCNLSNMSNMIKAYINKTNFSATLNGETASKNFSALPYYAEIANGVNGHQHAFLVNTDGVVNYISVGNACEGGKESADGNKYIKVDNTADDTTFDVIDFDFENDVAYCWNYGAGYNRVIPFRYVASVFTVNNNLTDITNSNSALTITEGEAYTATLTAIDGYEINSVIVTMGGVDVTATAYADGVISITNVTGNIVITATATKSGYTNVIDTVGYTDGYRLSTSTGNLSQATGYTSTGMITITSTLPRPVTVRTDGVNFNKSTSCAIVAYNSTGEKVSSTQLYNKGTSAFNGFTWSFDADGNMTMTYDLTYATYFKICGYGSGENLIVTINEEITD